MHNNLVIPERQGFSEGEPITNAAIQTDQSSRRAHIDSIADTETDQDIAEPGILFRPRLRFVTL
jgi:hypothetical protein